MNRADPYDQLDGLGYGQLTVNNKGLADMLYNLWDRNPVTIHYEYLRSHGKIYRPPAPQFASY